MLGRGGTCPAAYFGERFARRLRLMLSVRFRFAVSRFTFDRFATFRLERFPASRAWCLLVLR